MAAKPMLDRIPLDQVQVIAGDQNEILRQHKVPALEGDFIEDHRRRALRVRVKGVLTGRTAAQGIEILRTKFRAASPLPFVADIATATKINKVLIEDMSIRELAGKPNRFEYGMTLVEFISSGKSSAPSPPPSAPAPTPRNTNSSNLQFQVTANGLPRFRFQHAIVTLEGVSAEGRQIVRVLSNRSENIWMEREIPAGSYALNAMLTDPPMAASRRILLHARETKTVMFDLRPSAPIARGFVVHFAAGKSFVEPSMHPVLRQVVDYANSHPAEKLMLVGHSDAGGAGADNQLLSEHRARSVYACLTHGRAPDRAVSEWRAIRSPRFQDSSYSWGSREYQLMLQDLGYFQGQVGGDPESTEAAICDFQLDRGLVANAVLDHNTWTALIEAYLSQNSLALVDDKFLSCPWLGLAERLPVRSTHNSWRPNRRCEVLFAAPNVLTGARRNWVVVPVELGTVTVRGSIRFDDGTPVSELKYFLIAPDGECIDGERSSGPDRGIPVPGRTASDGTFAYPDQQKRVGVYSLEVRGPFLVRLAGEPRSAAKGTHVTKRLDESSSFDVWLSKR
jgi:outer membrane protein OmpA-like peptidoglycan-associated protein